LLSDTRETTQGDLLFRCRTRGLLRAEKGAARSSYDWEATLANFANSKGHVSDGAIQLLLYDKQEYGI
jgi:hypothetical protein